MASRLEIELTSRRDDGTWTWRAAGARQPKGDLDGALLPDGASVGDVLRAEAEFMVDGIEVVSVAAPKAARSEPERIELLGKGDDGPLVTTTLAPKGRGGRGGRRRDDDRDRGDRDRGDRDRGGRDRDHRERGGRGDRRDRGERGERSDRPRGPRPDPVPERPRPKRIRPGRTHRDAALAELPPEQRPVAEQLLRGGLPAVRTAIAEQNAQAAASGQPEVPAGQILTMAERLHPQLRDAEWADRAEAAARIIDEVDLRDLRSVVVAGETSARGEAGRTLLRTLQEGLERRLLEDQHQWVADMAADVGAGRFVRALRLSSRPPKAGMAVPKEVAERLAASVSEGLNERTNQELWAAALDALAVSPIRSQVTIAGRPAEPSADLLEAVRRVADQLPQIAALFGVDPSEAAAARKRRPRHPRGPRSGAAKQPAPARSSSGRGPSPAPAPPSDTAPEPVDAVEPQTNAPEPVDAVESQPDAPEPVDAVEPQPDSAEPTVDQAEDV